MQPLLKKRGKPTAYREEYAPLAYNYSLLGAKDTQLAMFFGVSETTINRWKKQHSPFGEALKKGKQIADAEVAKALYHRAKGYRCAEEKIYMASGEPVRVATYKEYPPDPTSIIFWLKNRQPQLWRDTRNLQGDAEHPIAHHLTIKHLSAELPFAESEDEITDEDI